MSRRIHRGVPAAIAGLVLGLGGEAWAQSGLYDVVGTDPSLGPYRGQVQLIDRGGSYDYTRLVRYQRPARPGGRALATAWLGTAIQQGNQLMVTVNLRRLGWITEVGGLRRTAADATPLTVWAIYRPDPAGGWAGTIPIGAGQAVEALTRTGPPGAPLVSAGTTLHPMHRPMGSWLKRLAMALFSNYHTLPQVAPYVQRQEFQDAVYLEHRDRTGFDWGWEYPGGDYLFAYWLARKGGVISATE